MSKYDSELAYIKHWWFRYKMTVFKDIHTVVKEYRTRTELGAYFKLLRLSLIHRWTKK